MAKPHILVLAGDDARHAISEAGFTLAGDDDVRRQTAAIVVETRGDSGAKAADLVRSLRAALGPRAGLFLAWSDGQHNFDPSVFDGVLDSTASSALLAARLGSSLRIAVMADEARLRFQTLARFGGPAHPPVINSNKTPKVLLFGLPGPDLLQFSTALNAQGADTIAAFTSFTAFDYLHESEFDAVVILARDDRPTAMTFCAAMRRNARMFHMPCLIVGSPDFDNPHEAIERGATDFAIAGDDDAGAVERLLTYIDEKRSRDALNLAFAAARAPAAIEPTTGLYSEAFFAAHLDLLAHRAFETDRPLSIAIARLDEAASLGAIRGRQAIERLIGQSGAMLSRLVRAEDVAARLDQTSFIVAFPSSDADAAAVAAERIAAVLECTAFDVQADQTSFSNDQPVQIKLRTQSASLAPRESALSLIRRVSRAIDQGQGS
ncbi:response regulator PleD [Candidatus Phycosocius bacilliformis]|uniref:Response regulator PleD n=1 Tax=Candidatus Phycosocius bacilliformis TaxID=1445552 RepID=A0A2P2EE88_9PROT|nr:diguanylate cyclase [Candidatus Phycosocius bacilliformis]GBF59372.1 response regulator PleD [Candidatus Phycosocius bacilliformis]